MNDTDGASLYKTKKELTAACEEYVLQSEKSMRETYETYGIIQINPCFYDVFRLDSSWVKGNEPYPWPLPEFFLDFRSSV